MPGVPQDVIILSFTESQVKLTIKTEVVAADFKLPDNRWNYVGVVWNGTTGDVSVYINGPEIKRARNILKGEILLNPLKSYHFINLLQPNLTTKDQSDIIIAF